MLHQRGNGLVNALFHLHRLRARRNRFQAFFDHRLRQNGRGRRAVTGNIVGLARHFAHQLRAHVGERVFDFDLFGNRHAVVDDARAAVLLFQHHVAPARAKRHLYGVRQLIDAPLQRAARFFVKQAKFLLPLMFSYYSLIASTSSWRKITYSSPPTLISVPPYLA